MMVKVILLAVSALLVASPALSRPQEPAPAAQASPQQQGGSTPVPIVSQSAETKEDGGFSYSFETGNGIKVEETGSLKQASPDLQARSAVAGEEAGNGTVVVLQGSFSYTAPDGQVISLRYIADENGFQPEGDHLPTAPPALQNAINDLKQNLAAQPGQAPQAQQPQQQEPAQPVQLEQATTQAAA